MRTIRTLMGCCVAIAAALPVSFAVAGEAIDLTEEEGVAQVSHCDVGCDNGCDDGCDGECCGSDSCGDGCGCQSGKCGKCRKGRLSSLKYGWNGEADYCGHGGHSCHATGWLAFKLNCLFGVQGGATHSPGHGYVLPVKRPMWDVSYPYNHMLNATAVGAANGQRSSSAYGNVYMPTDTTQLGYSYGHVPYWMPRAGMVPPTPTPDAYHLRVCLPDARGCKDGHCGHGHSHMTAAPISGGPYEVATEPTLAPVPQ